MTIILRVFLLICMATVFNQHANAEPPFAGTIFLDPDIIKSTDPNAFVSLRATGQGIRQMFDRRPDDWVIVNAYLFVATYDDGLQIEIQVNPEFGSLSAQVQASFYAAVFGRLPNVLRKDVKTSWIHKGDELFGGGNNNLLIHTGSIGQGYIRDGVLEEVLVHEASHSSLDATHASSPGWVSAQEQDAEFISNYARSHPQREDIAETFLSYLAQKYRAHRISSNHLRLFRNTVPARNAYFDSVISISELYPFEVENPSDGYYHLSTSFRGPNMRLDVFNGGQFNNMTHLVEAANYSGQFWKFTQAGGQWLKVTTLLRGEDMCLDIFNGGPFNNEPHLTNCANYSGQLWRLVAAGENRYKLVTLFRGDDMCLGIFNGGVSNNRPHLTNCANYSGQLWTLTPEQ